MPSNYPAGADDIPHIPTPSTTPTNDATYGAAKMHDQIADAINAIEADLLAAKGAEDSLADKIAALASGGGGGASIDDDATAIDSTWSSSKIAAEIASGGSGSALVWEVVDSAGGATLGRVILDAVLDDAYEYELDVHAISASGSSVDWTLLARLAGSSVTSGSYFGGGWAQSWGGGLAGWNLNSATARPLHYAAANDLTAKIAIRRADATLWVLDVSASRSGSSSIVCSGLGFVASDMDGMNFGPVSGTWDGSWSLRRRLIPT